ncbi:MAG TPA: GNAT family N-acetyltransferase, partial [Pirellulaceae bacterium]|nr:GNAT family N-acetyltransferase [Pirellulaceae bacterium]
MSVSAMPTLESSATQTARPTLEPRGLSSELIPIDSLVQPQRSDAKSAAIIAEWSSIAINDPAVLLEMHPDLVLGHVSSDSTSGGNVSSDDAAARRTAGQLWRCTSNDALDDSAALALLLDKTVSLPIVRGLKRRLTLRGLRLVGSRLAGGIPAGHVPADVARAAGDAANSETSASSNVGAQQKPTTVLDEFVGSVERLLSKSGGPSCLLMEDLGVDSPLWSAFEGRSGVRVVTLAEPQTRWVLRFPESAEAYWKRFSSKTRYNFRRQKRLLEHEWEVIEREDQVERFLADAAVVSANSWQGKRIGLRVSTEGSLADQCRQLARLGALRCYLLKSKGEPVAFAVGTQWNGRFSLEEIGYDTRFAEFSPGTVLLLNMLDDMFERNRPEVLDFGFGDGAYKQLFGTDSTTSGTRLIVSRRLGPAFKLAVNRFGAWIENQARSVLKSTGLTTKLRQ